uniref:Uncharacterized protein n=1 Tax=Anguilla anguilla TaxID=7936 RepID=A0A0E9VR95_ANGAN
MNLLICLEGILKSQRLLGVNEICQRGRVVSQC